MGKKIFLESLFLIIAAAYVMNAAIDVNANLIHVINPSQHLSGVPVVHGKIRTGLYDDQEVTMSFANYDVVFHVDNENRREAVRVVTNRNITLQEAVQQICALHNGAIDISFDCAMSAYLKIPGRLSLEKIHEFAALCMTILPEVRLLEQENQEGTEEGEKLVRQGIIKLMNTLLQNFCQETPGLRRKEMEVVINTTTPTYNYRYTRYHRKARLVSYEFLTPHS